jgi:hypothetical protein
VAGSRRRPSRPPSARPIAARDPTGVKVGSTIGVADPPDRLPDEGYYRPSAEHPKHVAGPDRQGDRGGDARVEQPHCDDLSVLESEDGDRPQEGQEKDGLHETHDVTPDEKFDDPPGIRTLAAPAGHESGTRSRQERPLLDPTGSASPILQSAPLLPTPIPDDEQPSCTASNVEHLEDRRDGIIAGEPLFVEFEHEPLAA